MTRRQRRTQIGGQFAPRLIEMLESPAYRVLSLSAHRVLARIEIEYGHHGGTDNGKLPVTYDDFEKYGIDRQAIAPAIREAVALGFVEITAHGRAGNAEWRTPNLFRLTYRNAIGVPTKDGCTHEWRKIKDQQQAELTARFARQAMPEKTKVQCGKKPISSVGNPHRKRQFHSGETHTTGHSGESHTTIDISGGVSRLSRRRRSPRRRQSRRRHQPNLPDRTAVPVDRSPAKGSMA
jgi:hypothetical protein